MSRLQTSGARAPAVRHVSRGGPRTSGLRDAGAARPPTAIAAGSDRIPSVPTLNRRLLRNLEGLVRARRADIVPGDVRRAIPGSGPRRSEAGRPVSPGRRAPVGARAVDAVPGPSEDAGGSLGEAGTPGVLPSGSPTLDGSRSGNPVRPGVPNLSSGKGMGEAAPPVAWRVADAGAAGAAPPSEGGEEGRGGLPGRVDPAPGREPLARAEPGAGTSQALPARPGGEVAGRSAPPGGATHIPFEDASEKISQLVTRTLLPAGDLVVQRLNEWRPPQWAWRTIAALVLGGQSVARIVQGRIHWRNTAQQLRLVGPRSLGVCLLTSAFVGMVFTIQFIREFARLGLTRSVGGVLALALSRELTPVITAIIVAGRVGSAFAAELGTMQVSEQSDSLRVLGSDPVDYLITPRVLASLLATPILNVLCFAMGMAASVLLADAVYDVHANIILESALRALDWWDIFTGIAKCTVFGAVIAAISCSWGFTTSGGAKGVGESTTSAVVLSLVVIFMADFGLSFLFFQGQSDALRQM